MNLQEKIENVLALLERNPAIENRTALAKFVTALNKAADELLSRAEPEMLRDTREYAELSALIALPENKVVINNDWFTAQAERVGRKYAKFTKKEKEEVLLELVKTKKADGVINELKSTPQQKAQRLLSELAVKSADKAEKQIGKMKPAELEEFCRFNQIEIEKNKKGAVDKKKTQKNVLAKLDTLREYLKM
jgi:hypothetical protein